LNEYRVHLDMPFLRDLVYGLRLFRRNPGFYLLGVLIISLGIGATTAIFSLIDGVLFNPLPYRDSARLAVIWSDFSRLRGNSRAFTSPALFFDWRDRSRSFESMAAFVNTNRTLTALERPVTAFTHEVTPNFFEVLGVQALRGRTFLADEGTSGKDDVALISYSLWQSAFAGSESVIGSSVELDGRGRKIVGILPASYRAPNNGITAQPDLFVPASFEKQRMERVYRSMVVIGRLREGVYVAQARTEIGAITAQIMRQTPEGTTPPGAVVNAIRDDLTGEFRRPFFLLQFAVGIMLLIACANVANLLLARYSARGYEFSVRTAIGASRGQIVRQLLAENLVLSGMGAIGGILFATWSLRPMLALVPAAAGLPFVDQIHISPVALGVALGLSVLCSVVFGLVPARQVSQADTAQRLVESGRSRSAGRSSALWRNVLIAAEIGLSLVLLASAGLLVQTFVHLSKESWGFDSSHILTMRNALRGESYRAASAQHEYFETAVRKLSEIPGVESVSAVNFPPPIAPFAPSRFIPSAQPVEPGHDPTATTLIVMPGYFETLRTPIVSGRSITDADTVDSAPVAVISLSVVKRYFPKGDPVGQSFRLAGSDRRDWRIVGIAQDVRGSGLAAASPDLIYFPHSQMSAATMTYVIRTRTAPMTVAPVAERSLWSLGKLMNVYYVGALEERLTDSYWQSRFTMALLAIFATLALLLATAGVYGVMSYLAAQRTQEIGIRIAIGASSRDVIWLVTNQGLRAAAAGLAAGVGGCLAMSRLLAGQLFGVSATDPLTLLVAAIGLMLVCMAASAIPAFRAARIDPLRALRHNG
jgi:putative ABC transport system permease protein